jgi:hypothetical protein
MEERRRARQVTVDRGTQSAVDHVELRLDNREDTRDILDFLIRGNIADPRAPCAQVP